jgi:SAM-dependent methyltransferase
MKGLYEEDLAYIHHSGFGDFARGAAPEIVSLLRNSRWTSGLVVDLGCGTGNLARALLDAGFDVLGTDISPAMIELAKRVAPAARFSTSSCYDLDIPACVAITAIGEVLTYVTPQDPREALPSLFSVAYQALAPGGLFVFDVIVRSRDSPMRYRSTRQEVDWQVDVDVDEEPEDSLLTRRISIKRRTGDVERASTEVHRVRTFTAIEIEDMLASAGFQSELSSSYGEFPLARQRLAVVARKPRATGSR